LKSKKKNIILFPVGTTDSNIIVSTAAFLESLEGFSFVCTIANRRPIPIGALNSKRGQYDCKRILKYFVKCCPENCFRYIGITDVNIYVPVLKYVFGLAHLGGSCAIVSTFRLRPEFYSTTANKWLFYERIYKTVLHELGHTVGLTHCSNPKCVMFSSTRIKDTDNKEARFCETCKELFLWYAENLWPEYV
jgi:archaemetzincin